MRESGWVKNEKGKIEPILKQFKSINNIQFKEDDVIKGIIHISKSIAYIKSGIKVLENPVDTRKMDTYREFYSGYFYISLGFEILYGEHCLKIVNNSPTKLLSGKGKSIDNIELLLKPSSKLKEYIENINRFKLLIGLNKSTQERIVKHLSGNNRNSIYEDEIFYLARAYRNAYAHGAISPTKLKQFGLTDSLIFLANWMIEKVNGTMEELVNRSVKSEGLRKRNIAIYAY